MRGRRPAVLLVAVLALVAGVLLVPVATSAPGSGAAAADLSTFQAGNIISDEVFYDSSTMTAAEIQQFLDIKGADCTATSTLKCLKDYTLTDTAIAANSFCPRPYAAGADERAATIVYKVAQACGINPQVLLVLLQKEQGSVTTTSPTESDYRIATGYGCPDTAACDTTYYGLRNQLYNAAKQFQRYRANPSYYPYRAGFTNSILWSPNAACGRSDVVIVNQATAGLYDYTPYRPNAAALAAGYGRGDSCSSYGNRNFYNYFTDWFGSTQTPLAVASDAIRSAYDSLGGPDGALGAEVGGVRCGLADSGCYQQYEHARIYYARSAGAHMITGAYYTEWAALGGPDSAIGYPTGEHACGLTGGGCYQQFQHARIYYAPSSGAHMITGAYYNEWATLGGPGSDAGYPAGDPVCGLARNGCYQQFEHARIYYAPSTGAHLIVGAYATEWAALGGADSAVGYPAGDPVCGLAGGGCYQQFEHARIYYSAASGAHMITGAYYNEWAALGGPGSAVGYPAGDPVCGLAHGGCYQQLEHARIYYSAASGAHMLTGAYYNEWARLGRERWGGGYPTGDPGCGLAGGGCYQQFEHARIYYTAGTGAHYVTGAVFTAWARRGAQAGVLGYPTKDPYAVTGGSRARFEHGYVTVASGTGVATVTTTR